MDFSTQCKMAFFKHVTIPAQLEVLEDLLSETEGVCKDSALVNVYELLRRVKVYIDESLVKNANYVLQNSLDNEDCGDNGECHLVTTAQHLFTSGVRGQAVRARIDQLTKNCLNIVCLRQKALP